MAATESQMIELGTIAPDFELLDTVSRTKKSLDDLKSEKATLVMFICNHCPFVKHINKALADLGRDYVDQGVSIIAISSNDVDKYPEDSPEKMTKNAKENNWNFPYLYDETQEVAKAYGAECTPDFFLFDSEDKLVYRGQLDDSRPNNGIPVTGKDLRAAIEAILDRKQVPALQKPSIGCNIKWKK
jgi:peroxiredoxin